MKRILPFICTLLVLSQCSPSCCEVNTLQITGAGSVAVDPDIAVFTIGASAEGKTSAVALSTVNTLIASATAALKSFGLTTSNFSSTGINLNPQYNYTDGLSILIGQQASQSLQVTVGNLLKNKNILGAIATALAKVDNITLSGFTFQNSNTDSAYRQARNAAVTDALSKARQYSQLSGKRLGSVRKIVDQNADNYVPFYSDVNYYRFRLQTLNVPFGKVTVSASVSVDWNITI